MRYEIFEFGGGNAMCESRKFALAFALLFFSLLSTMAGDLLFEENFDNYGNNMPGTCAESRVREWPPSQKLLAFEPTKKGLLFKDSVRIPKGATGWKNYELTFLFKFYGGGKPFFTLLLPTATTDKKKRKNLIRIGYGTPYAITCRGSKTFPFARKNDLPEKLAENTWYSGLVRVENGILEAFVDTGELIRIGLVELPENVVTRGFNIQCDRKVMFDYFKVVKLPAVKFKSALIEKNGVMTANRSAEYKLEIPSNANTAYALLKLGEFGQMNIKLIRDDVKKSGISVRIQSERYRTSTLVDGKWQRKMVNMPQAILQFRGPLALMRYVRPKLRHYLGIGLKRVVKNWNKYPAASEKFFKFEVRTDAKGIEFWIDGRYAGRQNSDKRLRTIAFELSPGGTVKKTFAGIVERNVKYLVFDTAELANPGIMRGAKSPIKPGLRTINGIPFDVAGASDSLDLGKVRENRGSWMLECDWYLSRTAFCGQKESFITSVPVAQYKNAYIICAVEEIPEKDPVLTVRLTQYTPSGQGPAITDTTITFPRGGEALPSNMKRLGKVKYNLKNGETEEASMYLVELPIKVGEIQDLLFQENGYKGTMMKQPYLDFEVLGKTDIVDTQQWSRKYKPDASSTSGVHVFGVTLEKTPVETIILPARKWSCYYPDQKPGADVTMRPLAKGNYTLNWTITNVHGKTLFCDKRIVKFDKALGERKFHIDYPQKKFGWYGVAYKLVDSKGRKLLEHTASFVLQPKNTRKAGYDSPYYTWWFGGAHGTPRTYEEMGPFWERCGIHRTNMLENWRAKKAGTNNEKAAAKWKLTNPYIKRQRSRAKKYSEKYREELVATIKDKIKNFPHAASEAIIFHESCRGTFPIELLGAPTPKRTKKQIETEKKVLKHGLFMAKLYRENFPNVKLIVGNTGNSLPGLASLFRQKFPAKYIDYMGDEAVGQTMPPEKNGLDGTAFCFWSTKELAKHFGYDLPVAACHEWKSRNKRSLGPIKTAAWPVRDALIAYANGSPLIPLRGPMEVNNAYWNSLWGDGMFTRNPQLYPTPSFAATAALTQILDRVKFKQQIPTGSLTTYAFQFSREDKKNVYPLWTARGNAEMMVEFDCDANVTVTDMYGASKMIRTKKRKLQVKTGEEVVYLTTSADVKSISTGKRIFPDDKPPKGAKLFVADDMSDASKWEIVDKVDLRVDNPVKHGNHWPFRIAGNYKLRQVKDAEKNECLEIELPENKKLNKLVKRYAMLKLKNSVEVSGKPLTLGVWVKGNSSWAKMMWEFEDAEGETWLSCGTGGYGCNIYDWPEQVAVNFDGWNFLQIPISLESPFKTPASPGSVKDQWRRAGNGNGKVDYPIKLTGIMVSMAPQTLYLKKMRKTKPVLRFKNLTAY